MSSTHYRRAPRGHLHRLLLPLFLACLVLLLACPFASSQSSATRTITPSPGFLADQPPLALTTNVTATGTFTLTYAYASVLPLLLTNASAVTLTVPAIFNNLEQPVSLPATSAVGQRAFLLLSTALTSTCQRADSAQKGQCTVTVTLTTPQPRTLVTYALYMLNDVTYSATYTNTLPPNTWRYYVQYIQRGDLAVQATLSPASSAPSAQLTAAMYISAAQALFTPGYPAVTGNGTASVSLAGQSCLIDSSDQDIPDWYIIGLYGFATAPLPCLLQLTSGNSASSGGGGAFSGYEVLSLLSLVLAGGFIGLVVLRGCCMYRQWHNPRLRASAASGGPLPADARMAGMFDAATFQTTAGQSGVLRTDMAAAGATDAEIAALPTMVYVRTVEASGGGGENDDGEDGEDPRCTICLDEFQPNVSHITALRCGHTFHSACVGAWLRQRRHCPLCLQLIDQATDVKQRRASLPAEVELADMRTQPQHSRPTVVVPAAAAVGSEPSADVASRTLVGGGTEEASAVGIERYSSAAQEEDADMCAIEIATPHHIGRPPL